ncbi:MBL fold metallo-hydrolase [Thermofilum sp.]|uniref:MBL fold metallo-hydrolase n=1 Tax=Thermofilum sp. TaxID=1961369 RepID=UPI00317A6B75
MKLRYGDIVLTIEEEGVNINSEICIDVFKSTECKQHIYTRQMENKSQVMQLSPEERAETRGTRVRAFPCKPCIGNDETGGEATQSYLVKSHGFSIYFHGCRHMPCNLEGLQDEKIDILILKIGSEDMSPEEASELVKTLKPALAIPLCHVPEDGHKFRDLASPYTQVVLSI